jgi:alkylation response protein AidB-like acyl-CoA dehydrogenase
MHPTPMRSFSNPAIDSYREMVRSWITSNLPEECRAANLASQPHDKQMEQRIAWDRIKGASGYNAIGWPERYGGRGEGIVEEFVFFEEAAKAHAPDQASFIGPDLVGPALMEFGTEEQKQQFLPSIASATELWCEGFSEPNAGSDLANVTTRADRIEGGYRIFGHKIWTSRAQFADWCYLLARTAKGPRRKNLSIFLLNMRQSGIRILPIRQITDQPDFCEVFFDGPFVSDQQLLGTENDGWKLAGLSGFRQSRRILSALNWYCVIKEAIDQLKADSALVVGHHQRVDELNARVSMLRWHIMRAAELFANGGNWQALSQPLKLTWSELWQDITECGVAFAQPESASYWDREYLESRSATIHGGTAQIQRNLIADRVLELPR